MDSKVCKCGNTNCEGFVLLCKQELMELGDIQNRMREKYGNVKFSLAVSPSSGEIFTKFYELHILKM